MKEDTKVVMTVTMEEYEYLQLAIDNPDWKDYKIGIQRYVNECKYFEGHDHDGMRWLIRYTEKYALTDIGEKNLALFTDIIHDLHLLKKIGNEIEERKEAALIYNRYISKYYGVLRDKARKQLDDDYKERCKMEGEIKELSNKYKEILKEERKDKQKYRFFQKIKNLLFFNK